jgi:hypothetical protein
MLLCVDCVLLHRESLKLILVDEPLILRWLCHSLSIFDKKMKGKELTDWSSGTGPSWRRLDSPNGAMASVEERCWWVVCGYE